MKNIKISGAELKELREEVLETKKGVHSEKKKIIFDGKQYSLRFPKRFIEEAGVKPEDFFEITLELPDPSTDERPKIKAELVRE